MFNCEALHVDVLWDGGDRVEGTLDTVTRTTFVRFPLKQAMTWGTPRSLPGVPKTTGIYKLSGLPWATSGVSLCGPGRTCPKDLTCLMWEWGKAIY